jgi:hypothetical protein
MTKLPFYERVPLDQLQKWAPHSPVAVLFARKSLRMHPELHIPMQLP